MCAKFAELAGKREDHEQPSGQLSALSFDQFVVVALLADR
jgi:hypothetical protein